jgi:uncharacterized membrane protein
MDWLQVALRILHIGAGVLWVGGAALFSLYVEPTLNALGPDAEKVINELIEVRKVPMYFAATSTLAVLGGVLLYWRDSNGLQLSWITSPGGLAFTIGGVSAGAAWLGGNVFTRPAVEKVGAIGAEMKAAGGPPSAELIGRMGAAQERLRRIGRITLGLLVVTVIAMASARYLY